MKRIVVFILLMFSIKSYSQEIYQQTALELKDVLDNDKSYLCKATTSIELLPGFVYCPCSNKEMSLSIDRYSVFPPSASSYFSVDNRSDNCVVGAIPGVLDLGATGSANYSIDIQLPQALGDMKPKLTIMYNSQSAYGLLGWSWDLLGLSSIERIGQTEFLDGKVTNVDFVNDRYIIDGQYLMPVGDNIYKTEIDNLDKIVAYNGNKKGHEYFVVWKADGTKWEYGTTEDSKIEPQGRTDVVLKWLLCKITDRNGNSITYDYVENNAIGESYVKRIQYTSNEDAEVKPAYSVVFDYIERSDASVGYVCGTISTNAKIISKIEVINNYSGKKIIEYDMDYHKPGYYDDNNYIHYRLSSIQHTVDGVKINPTRIVWNSKDKWSTDNSCGFKKYELDKTIFNRVPFVGDFNGDGFSDVLLLPYKVQDVYQTDVEGEVYINNGDGSFAKDPLIKITFNKNLDWVYVCDIDGDDDDDIIPYEIHLDKNGNFENVKISVLVMSGKSFVNKKNYTFDKMVSLIPGNYVARDKCGLLVVDSYNGKNNKDLARCIYFKNGDFVSEKIQNSNIVNGKDVNCLAIDVTGDGISELLSLEENGYRVFDIKVADVMTLGELCSGNDFTYTIHPFPNDYNGDGKMDLLYYDPAKFWNIVVSTGTGFLPPDLCVTNHVLRYVRLNDKDRYRYSLKEMQKPTVTVRTADFDGDGTADVGVFNNSGGNHYLHIGFSLCKDNQSSYSFLDNRRYYMPINYSHQTIQLGRFLPQENISILSGLPRNPSSASKSYVVSICPNSAYYSVEKIIDGMGNSTELLYEYLVKSKPDFYTCSGGVDYEVRKKSVPILALKEQKTYSINGKPLVKKYDYYNAMVHKCGHGFVGFGRVNVRNYVDDKLVNKSVREYSIVPMGYHCIPMLTLERLFYGENQLIKECSFEYKKYACNKNSKVFIPLLLKSKETVYDVDKRKFILKYIITVNDYISDVSNDGFYNDIVHLKMTNKGYDNVQYLHPEECRYHEKNSMTYEDNVDNWIINRPQKIVRYVSDKACEDIVGDVRLIEYDGKNSLRVIKETMIPNKDADASDSLTLVVKYRYDKVGNVIERSVSSPSIKWDKVVKMEYGENYRYRYKTKTIDEIGREVVCKYDDNFGILNATIDYNNHITRIEKDPFGSSNVILMPDGMKDVKVLCWSANNEYAPKNSTYYSWEKSVGKAETMVFYHKSGVELRRVTFDINGKAVFLDKEYDDQGNLKQESYPYYEKEDKLFVRNVYDVHNRIVEKIYPDGSKINYSYDGNSIQTEHTTIDGLKKCKKEEYNFMGWLTNVIDNGGNEVKYEYYSDGKIKSAQIGEKRNTRISIAYDGRRNRMSIKDPNYGTMSYKNDALGNIKKIVNVQYVVDFEYDILGRMMVRKEHNLRDDKKRMVRWEYSCDYGYDGLVSRVYSTGGHQIDYIYDDKLRVKSVIEQIAGKKYKTDYSYDKANRVSMISYPSGFSIIKEYSNSGFEEVVRDAETEMLLWKTNETNSNGYVTEYQLGNGSVTECSYNPYNFMIEKISTREGSDVLQDLSYEYDGVGNLVYRCDGISNNCEKFEYDSYDRLTDIILNNSVESKMTYGDNGNVLEKNVGGVDVLYNASYAVEKPNAILNAKTEDEKVYESFNRTLEFSTYDNVVGIKGDDKSLLINYGYDNNRIFMQYNVGGKDRKKTYVSSCEYIEENGKTKVLTYLEGPMGVFAVHVDDAEEYINYIHKDNLESWNVITDEDADVLQRLSFDAWGNLRNPERWDEDVDNEPMLYDRGFTGHEHLWEFGLINMNGRLYDPLLSMMLSPDNNIQIPQSSQSFNRYSYCLNNPLKYYDPTGEFVESIAFGVAGGAANLVFNARNIDSFGEAALLFGVGFVKGFLMEYTMGQSWFLQVGIGAVTEGLVAGANCMVNIGDGNFEFSGDDWNSVKSASHYGLGSGLVKSFMYSYFAEPTETQYGESFFESSYHREYSHGLTSIAAHGMGCWFSGQPFLPSMKFKDVGFDLKMLGIIAKRLMSSYLYELGFGEKALDERAKEIKNSILNDLLTEIPDTPDFEYTYDLLGVFVDDFRLYVVGNIYQMIPGERLKCYPKPYMEEVITFPFSYSLFKTLFFNNE